MQWNVIDTVNLFHSGIGLCDWQIHLCHEGILAVPEGLKHAVNVGVAAGFRDPEGAAQAIVSALHRGGEQVIADAGDETWLRFPVDQIQRIVLRKKFFFGSRMRIELTDGREQKFATDNRGATHQARVLLASIYGHWYVEEKFKKPPDRRKAAR